MLSEFTSAHNSIPDTKAERKPSRDDHIKQEDSKSGSINDRMQRSRHLNRDSPDRNERYHEHRHGGRRKLS